VRVVILGCGRIGAKVAEVLDGEGHDVLIIDESADSFNRLNPSFRGRAVVGVGIDEEVLGKADLGHADAGRKLRAIAGTVTDATLSARRDTSGPRGKMTRPPGIGRPFLLVDAGGCNAVADDA
jgi:predicted dinucleotide-utilizing enzyme